MPRPSASFSTALLLFCLLLRPLPLPAVEELKAEFDAVCGKTHNALNLSAAEINELIGRCDALKPRLEKLGPERGTERKVFLQRLKMCREFYAFALSTKEENCP